MRTFGPKSFNQLYHDLTQATFKKYGFINGKLMSDWQTIVGSSLAQICQPDKIVFEPGQTRNGVLYIVVTNPAFGLEIQTYEGRIIEKIATYFGYKAVSKMRVILKPVKISAIIAAKNKSNSSEIIESKTISIFPKNLQNVQDEELKEALSQLFINIVKKR